MAGNIPLIAIVGRPNVGKSTLFNRFVGHRKAVTSEISGTTRDRIYCTTEIGDYLATLVDTGGLSFAAAEDIEKDVQTQAHIAIANADVILFLVDPREDMTAADHDIARMLRQSKKPVILILNKCDSLKAEEALWGGSEFGFAELVKTSAIHNRGISGLIGIIGKMLRKSGFRKGKMKAAKKQPIAACFLGRPNVGKSSLVNRLLGEERIIVSEKPGTTRDTIDTELSFGDTQFILIDTAGLRRRGKVRQGIEKYSVLRGLQALQRSDIAFLVLDYTEPVAAQDCHVAQYALEEGKGFVIVVNKKDLVETEAKERHYFLHALQQKMHFASWAPVVFTSAKTGEHVVQLLRLAEEIAAERKKQVNHTELSLWLSDVTMKFPPPSYGRRRPRFRSISQLPGPPPTFKIKASFSDSIHPTYRRYLENRLRERFGFNGTAVRLEFF